MLFTSRLWKQKEIIILIPLSCIKVQLTLEELATFLHQMPPFIGNKKYSFSVLPIMIFTSRL